MEQPVVDQPRLWRLILQIDTDAIRAVAYSTVEDSSMLQFSVALDQSGDQSLKSLEEAVYANPFLLSDFGKVDVVVRTPAFFISPAAIDAIDATAGIMQMSPDHQRRLKTDYIDSLDVSLSWALAEDFANFLARTFRNPAVWHHLTPLLRYFSRKTLLGNSGKVYVHLHRGSASEMDIIAFDASGRFVLAETRQFETVDDAAYFALSSAKIAGIDFRNDEMLVCGHNSLREQFMGIARNYFNYVMPNIFPSAVFRVGKEALSAPFPLIILPLCE